MVGIQGELDLRDRRRFAMAKILIVDDEPHLRLLYETELRRAGLETMTASNAEQALEYVETMKPDLVVLDIRMAGMDGIEALQRILDMDNTIPVILNTAYSSYKENFLTWSADAYVTKSSDVSELLAKVKELLAAKLVEN
jgi:DNA-binding response OmpR family regulator